MADKNYGCHKLAHCSSFAPMMTSNKLVTPFYCCVYCDAFTYHVERGARTRYAEPYNSKKSKGKRKKFTCRDVMSLLDKGPGVRR